MKKEDFIAKAREKHGDRYDYRQVPDEFLTKNKVEIICQEHGSFWQTASDHKAGCGCNLCGIELSRSAKIKTKDYFIDKAKQVHGDLYDYSKVEYLSAKTKVVITCNLHGDFLQIPNSHLKGRGCPHCGLIKIGNFKRKSFDVFVDQANTVHCNKYVYFNDYVNGRTPLTIICPHHGTFKQSPENHLSGQECPSCAVYGYDPKIPCCFYVNLIGENHIKFGITRDLKRRVLTQNSKTTDVVVNIFSISLTYGALAKELEDSIKQNTKCGVLDKDQLPDGYTETLKYSDLDSVYDLILKFFAITHS